MPDTPGGNTQTDPYDGQKPGTTSSITEVTQVPAPDDTDLTTDTTTPPDTDQTTQPTKK